MSYAIRLLLLSSENCDLADELIKQFHFLTYEAYTDKVFSANIHSLNHLAWQVKCYGPLWCTSAIMFESANYLLRCKFTGTVSHLKVLVERYIRNKNSMLMSPQRDRLYGLCRQFREKKRSSDAESQYMKFRQIFKILLPSFTHAKSLNSSQLTPRTVSPPRTPLFLLSPVEKNASVKFACSIHSISRNLFLCMSSM